MNETLRDNLSLSQTVSDLIKRHLEQSGKATIDLHQMVLEQIEPPLLKAVMERYKYNQSRAAIALGISRGTCRKLLIKYFGELYCGSKTPNEAL